MRTLIDANVLLDLFTNDANWQEWSRKRLFEALITGDAVINPIIYAEISAAFAHEKELQIQIQQLDVRKVPLPYAAAFLAMRAFLKYRRSGGKKRSPLPDFFIGAHAEVEGLVLLTRDDRRYGTYFPSVDIISPATV